MGVGMWRLQMSLIAIGVCKATMLTKDSQKLGGICASWRLFCCFYRGISAWK